MKKKIAILLILLSIVSATIADTTISFEKAKKARTQDDRRAAFREQYEQLSSVTVYGKVVDQYGDPVKQADVLISWSEATWLIGKEDHGQRKRICTDADGRFQFSCEKPWEINAEATKDGYEAPMGGWAKLFGWGQGATARNSPATIILRKKGPTSFLVVSPGGSRPPDELFWTKGTNSLTQPLDLLAWSSDTRWRRCATSEADLRIYAAFDSEKKCWAVTYAVTNEAKGVILSNSLFYEAPESGYVPQAMVIVTNQEQGCYLYLKSRTPAVYSRIQFNHVYNNRSDQSLRLYCKAWINPYGERNLEYDNSLEASWRVVDELKAEAKQAIHAKKLPPKPDIPQRIKATSERVAREKAESDKRHKEWVEQQKKQKE